jgi:hypothetical protein
MMADRDMDKIKRNREIARLKKRNSNSGNASENLNRWFFANLSNPYPTQAVLHTLAQQNGKSNDLSLTILRSHDTSSLKLAHR